MAASLVLGPLLRWVGATSATVWVEVSEQCTVEVLGARDRTFQVHGRHYALVVVEGLAAAAETAYDVRLDGEVVWPEPDSHWPRSVIRTEGCRRDFRLSFGSCRLTMRHEQVNTLFHGVCALRAIAESGRRDADALPDLLFMAGDQVYADELTPEIREIVRHERSGPRPPKEQIADYEEYARLYGIAWSDPALRWLLSTVPSAMIFDDHDVIDDWNTSQAWRDTIGQEPWWHDRIVGAMGSYWVYQHLGNLSPDELAADDMWRAVRAHGGETADILDPFAQRADEDRNRNRWSYARDWGRTRLLVIDTRCARQLEPGSREIVGGPDWEFCQEKLEGDVDHLLVGSSLPLLLPRPLSDLEGWNEAVADGVWGRRWAGIGEKVRQGADLEHWAAFRTSFVKVSELLAELGGRPDGPATVAVLSGDVHYSYVARAEAPDGGRFTQVTCSPLRNPLGRLMVYLNVFAFWQPVAGIGRMLAARAGVAHPRLTWEVESGPWFDNAVATVRVDGAAAEVTWHSSVDDRGRIGLVELGRAPLSLVSRGLDTGATPL